MPSKSSLNLLSLFLGTACLCSAGNITYNVNQTVGAGTATGYVVTDGTIGVLSAANFLNWNLLLSDGTSTFDVFGPGNGQMMVSVIGTAVSATPTQLSFNFGAPGFQILDFLAIAGGYLPGVCFSSAPNCEMFNGVGEGIGASVMIYSTPQFKSFSGTQVIASTAPEPSTFALVGAVIALFGFHKRATIIPETRPIT